MQWKLQRFHQPQPTNLIGTQRKEMEGRLSGLNICLVNLKPL